MHGEISATPARRRAGPIANRGTWTVTAIDRDGQSNVTPPPGDVTADQEDAARASPSMTYGRDTGGGGPQSPYDRVGAGVDVGVRRVRTTWPPAEA